MIFLYSLVLTCLSALVVYLGRTWNEHPKYSNIPKLSRGFLARWIGWEPTALLRLQEYESEGYRKYNKKGLPFVVKLFGIDAIIMPSKYLSMLAKFDRHALNFGQHLHDNMSMEATVGDIAIANDMEIDLISKHINLNMTPITKLLSDEAEYNFQKQLGDLKEFRKFNAYSLSSMLVHPISSRILVGQKLCRDPGYMKSFETYSILVFIGGVMWNILPLGAFRKSFYNLASFKFRWDLNRTTDYIVPAIASRMKEIKEHLGDRTIDLIQFAVDQDVASPRENDARRHAQRISQVAFAASGTSIGLVYNLIWEMLRHPEHLEPIRSEIIESLQKFGGWGDKKMLSSLTLLDSFIRETLRHHPAACFSGQRTAMEELEFPDGVTVETGSRIAFAAKSTNMDPDNYTDANVFDGFRFAGPNFSTRSEQKIHAVTIDDKFLSWGYGKQSCPGRFYAVGLVKLVFGKLLHEYQIDWATEDRDFPKGMIIEGTFLPSMNAEIKIRINPPA